MPSLSSVRLPVLLVHDRASSLRLVSDSCDSCEQVRRRDRQAAPGGASLRNHLRAVVTSTLSIDEQLSKEGSPELTRPAEPGDGSHGRLKARPINHELS